MKKILLVAVVLVSVLTLVGGAFAATIGPQVNVTGTVNGKCAIVTNPGDMAFTIDPDLAGPFAAVVGTQPEIKCSKSHPYTVACTSLNSFNLVSGVESIPYTFSCPGGGSGIGFGAAGAIPLTIGGSVVAGYADAAAGAGYADTVTLTVTY